MRKIDKNYLNIHKKNENRKKVVKIKKNKNVLLVQDQ